MVKNILKENSSDSEIDYQKLYIKEKEEREKREFLIYALSHEGGNYMNTILGFSEILQESKYSKNKEEFATIIHKSASHLQDLMDFVKFESNGGNFVKTSFNNSIENIISSYKQHKDKLFNKEINLYYNEEEPMRINNSLSKMVLSTVLGDSVKRMPIGTSTEIAINQNSIMIENYFDGNKIQIKGIGENRGFGSEIVKYAENKGVSFEKYSSPKINNFNYNSHEKTGLIHNEMIKPNFDFYGVNITFPVKKQE